jgi:hypothetical protein
LERRNIDPNTENSNILLNELNNLFGYIDFKIDTLIDPAGVSPPIKFTIAKQDDDLCCEFNYTFNDRYVRANPDANIKMRLKLHYRFALTMDYELDSNKVIFESNDTDDLTDLNGTVLRYTVADLNIKVKLVLNIKDKVKYYNTSPLLSFFRTYYGGMKNQLEENIKILFNPETYSKYKYNYFMMYNLMNQINFNVNEFVAHSSFIHYHDTQKGLIEEK